MTKAEALETVLNVLWLAVEQHESSNSGIVEDHVVLAIAKNIDPLVQCSYQDAEKSICFYRFTDGSNSEY